MRGEGVTEQPLDSKWKPPYGAYARWSIDGNTEDAGRLDDYDAKLRALLAECEARTKEVAIYKEALQVIADDACEKSRAGAGACISDYRKPVRPVDDSFTGTTDEWCMACVAWDALREVSRG